MIIAIEVVTCFQLTICSSVFEFGIFNSSKKCYLQKLENDLLLWIMIQCQTNEIIYLFGNLFGMKRSMKRYYSNLLNCGKDTQKKMREAAHPKMSLNGKTKEAISRFHVSSRKS